MRRNKIQKKKPPVKPKPRQRIDSEESITSQSVSEQEQNEAINENFNEFETPDEKRLRLAKKLIEDTKKALKDDPFFVEGDDQTAEFFLKQEALKQKRLSFNSFEKIQENFEKNNSKFEEIVLKGHQRPITCCAFSPSNDLYTAAKDSAILKFEFSSSFARKVFNYGLPKDPHGHQGEIYCLSISSDGKFMLSGGADRLVKLWSLVSDQKFIADFAGHKAAIHGVAFRQNSTECLSVSADRTMKIWEYQQKGLIQTMYGHRSEMMDVATMSDNVAVSVSYDRVPIVWKLDKETQTVFAEQQSSLDCVASLDRNRFVTGSENGEIAMWNITKQKPIWRLPNIHSRGWVSSLAAQYNGDFLVSGANDGIIRVYKLTNDILKKEIEIESQGIVSCMRVSEDGSLLAVVEGQENRLGRWTTEVHAKSRIRIIKLF